MIKGQLCISQYVSTIFQPRLEKVLKQNGKGSSNYGWVKKIW